MAPTKRDARVFFCVSLGLSLSLLAAPAVTCELLVAEHRSARPLHQLAIKPQQPEFSIIFEHSVLGTTVIDTYQVRVINGTHQTWLIRERFQGQGYGLPSSPGPFEQLKKVGDDWVLSTNRLIDPLVIRPLRIAAMRLQIGEKIWLLADLLNNPNNTNAALALSAQGCGKKEPSYAVQ